MGDSTSERFENFRRGDNLAGVALRVVGNVDKGAADGGWELFAADRAGRVEVGVYEGADASGRVREGSLNFGDEGGEGFALVVLGADLLGFEEHELVRGELVAFGVGEDAIGGARDVAQVEGQGRQAEGQSADFEVGQAGGPDADVVEGKLQGVQDGAGYGGNVSVGAGEPGLGAKGGCVR